MNKITKNFQWKWFLFIIPFIVIGLYLWYLNSCPIDKDFDKAGKLGDSFGVLNSLFSGLAFIALVITIYLQQQDIRDTKKETQKQTFENTFFNLIKLHNDLVANFRQYHILDDGTQHFMYGGEAISYFLDNFKEGGFTGFYSPDESLSKEENIKYAYQNRNIDSDNLKTNLEIKLGRKNLKFIENVYSSLNLIDRANLDEKAKMFYLELLHTQISDEELVLIFYYTLAKHSDKKSLLEKYHFFKSLNTQLLHNLEKEILLYKKEAFEK